MFEVRNVYFLVIATTEFVFAGIKMFWARLKLSLTRAETRVRMSYEKGQKHIYAQEHELYNKTVPTITEDLAWTGPPKRHKARQSNNSYYIPHIEYSF